MPKINREEYEILRKVLSDGYEWIARDSHNPLCAHRHKPVKQNHWIQQYRGNAGNGYKEIDDRLFQFIQWEDPEPYNIVELIEEYEDSKLEERLNKAGIPASVIERVDSFEEESEETEVKKDMGWAKKKISDIEHKIEDELYKDDTGFRMTVRLEGMMDVIQEIKGLINQLDEPETLSPNWIRENVEYAHYMTPEGTYSSAKAVIDPDKLKEVLVPKQEEITEEQAWQFIADNYSEDGAYWWDVKNHYESLVDKVVIEKPTVPKQELPAIPKFVAEWISEHHERFDLYPALRRLEEGSTRDYDVYKWYRKNTCKFVNAYLTGVYEVEKEQKYRVVDNTDVHLLCKVEGEVITVAEFIEFSDISDVLKPEQYNLTEQEIKDYDKRYLAFKVPVEELEE